MSPTLSAEAILSACLARMGAWIKSPTAPCKPLWRHELCATPGCTLVLMGDAYASGGASLISLLVRDPRLRISRRFARNRPGLPGSLRVVGLRPWACWTRRCGQISSPTLARTCRVRGQARGALLTSVGDINSGIQARTAAHLPLDGAAMKRGRMQVGGEPKRVVHPPTDQKVRLRP